MKVLSELKLGRFGKLHLGLFICRALSTASFQLSPLTTEVTIPRSTKLITSTNDGLLFFGSCFGEVVRARLQNLKFSKVGGNPQGIAFNPVSIADSVLNSMNGRVWASDDLNVSERGTLFSWDHHTRFSSLETDGDDMLQAMNLETMSCQKALDHAEHIFLTLGTARVHFLASSGRVVANCHKMPSTLFSSRLLTVDECLCALRPIIQRMRPGCQMTLTVSPVRHTKETLQNNCVSKSILRLVCSSLVNEFPEKVIYFPSFEIVLDELRDYRFYEEDMIHPTKAAHDIVFRKFASAYFNDELLEGGLFDEISRIRSGLNHRVSPRLAKSAEYQAHLKGLLSRIENLMSKENVDYSIEIEEIRKKLDLESD
jgi:hypothetical protein